MAGDRGIRAGSSGGSLTGGIAGSGGGIGLGSGNVGPAIATAKMREKSKRSSDRRNDWKKPLPRDQIEGVESFTGLRTHPNAVRSAVVGEVAIRRGETYSGRGLRPSGDGRKHGDGDRLAGSR